MRKPHLRVVRPQTRKPYQPATPELTIDRRGTKTWRLNGKLHRTDGPAIEHADGFRLWYQHGKLHRTDGPAIEWPNGTGSWYRHGHPTPPPLTLPTPHSKKQQS